jgi:hypothetical protein
MGVTHIHPIDAEYDRLFDTLAQMAADLDISEDDAEELINDVLLTTLVGRHISDVDTFVTAAFKFAASHRGARMS